MISCSRKKLKRSQNYNVSLKNAEVLYKNPKIEVDYTKMTTDITLIEKHPLSFFCSLLRIITNHPKK